MSEDRNADETAEEKNSSPVSRRSFVKGAGAGAFGASMIGFSGVSEAAETGIDVRRLSDATAGAAVRTARHTSDFKALRKHIHKGYGMKPAVDNADTYDVTVEGANGEETYEVVDIPIESHGRAERGDVGARRANIAVLLQGEAFVASKATIVGEYRSDGLLGVTSLQVTDGTVETEYAKIDPETATVQSDGVSAQISQCGACREIVDFVCRNGCGFSGAAACLLAGIVTVVGGIACPFIFTVICNNISGNVEDACDRSTRGVCADLGFC